MQQTDYKLTVQEFLRSNRNQKSKSRQFPVNAWAQQEEESCIVSKPGMGKLWPEGHMQPIGLFNPLNTSTELSTS